MICVARKSNTSNPFILYNFFDKLEEILKENPQITAEKIWNCDASRFPTDPAKCKVIFNSWLYFIVYAMQCLSRASYH